MFGSPVPLVLAFRKMSGESLRLKLDTESGKFWIKLIHLEYKMDLIYHR